MPASTPTDAERLFAQSGRLRFDRPDEARVRIDEAAAALASEAGIDAAVAECVRHRG